MFKFWDPLYISGMAEATAFQLDLQIDYKEYCQTGDVKKLAAFDMFWYRWILSTKHSKTNVCGSIWAQRQT